MRTTVVNHHSLPSTNTSYELRHHNHNNNNNKHSQISSGQPARPPVRTNQALSLRSEIAPASLRLSAHHTPHHGWPARSASEQTPPNPPAPTYMTQTHEEHGVRSEPEMSPAELAHHPEWESVGSKGWSKSCPPVPSRKKERKTSALEELKAWVEEHEEMEGERSALRSSRSTLSDE
ncbi:hypothetical protein MPH_07798 [Macrophomina phaseolina MS6]|uniref:Uncharacterized protein n=1 Tax=Macrophomina phaseolina (strain MS6) TaxID=1126212 RepID=K2RXT8_MACPH|nr:hypothetical protein MPH_07798 [Macrophomina phaseolina MS6]